MHARKELAEVLDQILSTETVKESLERTVLDEYKKLNDKCDAVIDKIKDRKSKKTCTKIAGE